MTDKYKKLIKLSFDAFQMSCLKFQGFFVLKAFGVWQNDMLKLVTSNWWLTDDILRLGCNLVINI